ncbi:MAG: hypothetical protein NXY57DRAFT_959291 [Lentinula lateritia]|nr:MAG: hypothetical protein NXY57DRAFT_959291 [Lentinula lateritia]
MAPSSPQIETQSTQFQSTSNASESSFKPRTLGEIIASEWEKMSEEAQGIERTAPKVTQRSTRVMIRFVLLVIDEFMSLKTILGFFWANIKFDYHGVGAHLRT